MRVTNYLQRVLFGFVIFFTTQQVNAQWKTIAGDPVGDGTRAELLDATLLEYKYERAGDSLYFRFTVDFISPSQATDFGVNIMIDIPDAAKFNFWGNTNNTAWAKLVTFWVTGVAPYVGIKGVANAQGVNTQNYTNLHQNNLSVELSQANKTITIGMRRKDLITDAEMGGKSSMIVRTAGAVGSSTLTNDDLLSVVGEMMLDNIAVGINRPQTGIAKLYPNPATGVVNIELPAELPINKTVSVTNVLGKTQQIAAAANGNVLTVNTEQLATGIYWLTVGDAQGKRYCEKLSIVK